ncbi:MAG: tRNA lysidine(34) synthetase TilS [Bacteroidales bacterium]|nr:tRNA lysidine(34) synthetase TilS [Bacteroidales bacterium]
MIEDFRKYISGNDLFSPHEKILIAVSGGIDSMVMVHLFLRCGYEFGIAHCNFNLRGNESDEDEKFVRSFAERHDLPFYAVRFDTEAFATGRGLSIQMAARELRYTWFEELRKKHGYSVIALAHNLNDNIETFFINLIRGSGLSGFAGIRPKNDNLVRPLLFATRSSIKEYCEKYEVSFREDSSNASTKYVRNKIRHLIIPVLKEINPSFENTIEETISRVTEINEIYSGHISKIKGSLIQETKTGYVVPISEMLSLTPLNTMLFELFRSFGISRPMIPELIKLTASRNGSQLITSTHRFIRNRSEIIIDNPGTETETNLIFNSLEELVSGKLPGRFTVIKCDDDFSFPRETTSTCLSLNKLKFPVRVRNWKPGDVFYPLGMNKKKKLSDFFIDNKFSIPEKEAALVLESEGKIACILGIRTDHRFRITGSTTRCLVIEDLAD